MEAALQPWEVIAWSPEHEQSIYKDWGLFYTHKQQLDIAAHYYDKCLELNNENPRALLFRSMCKREIAQTKGSLEDAYAALAIEPNNALIKLEICIALYELNQFENTKAELHDNTRFFSGKKVGVFIDRLIVVDENFKDSLGEALSPFILRNRKTFDTVWQKLMEEKYVETRPQWKVLKAQGKCDVLSILEKEDELLPPIEVARRERALKVFNQIYFNKSWIDVLFLKHLRDNPNLLLPYCRQSTPFLRFLTRSKNEVITKFMKMLQARSPLYNEMMNKCPNRKVFETHREAHLNRIQYQTRRNMLTILRMVRKLRAEHKVDKLSKYIEEVMGDYVVLKSHRVMPWKFEFINEIYNTLALAHADMYTIPADIQKVRDGSRMIKLLRIPIDKNKDRVTQFVFGDRSTYQQPDATDYSLIAYKKFLVRLEKRLYFAKYSIEKCYILHEIARAHLEQSRFDECCSAARKATEECKNCNSLIWQFLSILLICKGHAALHKIERIKLALDEAYVAAERLKDKQLQVFIDMCRLVNEEDISMKKKSQSMHSLRSRNSLSSRQSASLQSNEEDDFDQDKRIASK